MCKFQLWIMIRFSERFLHFGVLTNLSIGYDLVESIGNRSQVIEVGFGIFSDGLVDIGVKRRLDGV